MLLVSMDSITVRAHHDAAGIRVSQETVAAREEAAPQKGVRRGNTTGRTVKVPRAGPSGDASDAGGGPG